MGVAQELDVSLSQRRDGMEDSVRVANRGSRAQSNAVCNSFAERWVGTARREMLDHLLNFGRQHLEARPHQWLGQRRPCEPAAVIPLTDRHVERRDRLGGLLNEYCRAA